MLVQNLWNHCLDLICVTETKSGKVANIHNAPLHLHSSTHLNLIIADRGHGVAGRHPAPGKQRWGGSRPGLQSVTGLHKDTDTLTTMEQHEVTSQPLHGALN